MYDRVDGAFVSDGNGNLENPLKSGTAGYNRIPDVVKELAQHGRPHRNVEDVILVDSTTLNSEPPSVYDNLSSNSANGDGMYTSDLLDFYSPAGDREIQSAFEPRQHQQKPMINFSSLPRLPPSNLDSSSSDPDCEDEIIDLSLDETSSESSPRHEISPRDDPEISPRDDFEESPRSPSDPHHMESPCPPINLESLPETLSSLGADKGDLEEIENDPIPPVARFGSIPKVPTTPRNTPEPESRNDENMEGPSRDLSSSDVNENSPEKQPDESVPDGTLDSLPDTLSALESDVRASGENALVPPMKPVMSYGSLPKVPTTPRNTPERNTPEPDNLNSEKPDGEISFSLADVQDKSKGSKTDDSEVTFKPIIDFSTLPREDNPHPDGAATLDLLEHLSPDVKKKEFIPDADPNLANLNEAPSGGTESKFENIPDAKPDVVSLSAVNLSVPDDEETPAVSDDPLQPDAPMMPDDQPL